MPFYIFRKLFFNIDEIAFICKNNDKREVLNLTYNMGTHIETHTHGHTDRCMHMHIEHSLPSGHGEFVHKSP